MADDHGTTGKFFQTFFQSPERVHVDVVRRFVEQQHVTLFFQGHGQVQTVALTSGEYAAFLFLVGPGEIEPAQVCTDIDVAVSHTHQFVTAAHDFIHALFRRNVLMRLVYVG